MPGKLTNNYRKLVENIGGIYQNGRKAAFQAVDTTMVLTYWNIGREIVEFEQKGRIKAEYGSGILEKLSKDLKLKHGPGFSRSNIVYMRLLYIKYPKSETLSHRLSWSKYFELLKISDDRERNFYGKQCIIENWSVRELKRQKNSAMYHRLALSRDKQSILKISKKGHTVRDAGDVVKDPYVFEFLGMKQNTAVTERKL